MNTQISFTLPENLKSAFAKKAKEDGVSMKTIFLAFMKKYSDGVLNLDFGFFSKKDDDFYVTSKEEVIKSIKAGLKSIKEGKKEDFIDFDDMMKELKTLK